MKIIIIGDGKVGYNLADYLSKEKHDITIIDKNAEKLRDAMETLDVCCTKGNGLSTSILLSAGVREADLLIAVTNSDEMNMVCCMTAKKLGARHTIARIRDPEYADELSQLKYDLDLDMVINPEQAIASEIARLLEFPSALSVEMFARGRVVMVGVRVTKEMPLPGQSVREVSQKFSSAVLIGAILRGQNVLIPGGSTTIQKDDVIYTVGHPAKVFGFCARIGLNSQEISDVMIVGGGKIAHYLAEYMDEINVRVKIIDVDHERCRQLDELLPRALIIHGDGTDDKMLRAENISDMGGFVALTNLDEENFMTALLAKRFGVPRVIAKINRKSYRDLNVGIGIDELVSPKEIIAAHIVRYVNGLHNAMNNPGNTLYRIINEQAEMVEFIAGKGTKLLDIPLRKLKLIPGVLVGIIIRKNLTIIPHGNDAIKLQDSVILITKGQRLADLNDILAPED